MENFIYKPTNVCSTEMKFEVDNNIIKSVEIVGGCPGNSVGVSLLCKDKDIDEVIDLLSGITCRLRKTSCPDQLAQALIEYKNKRS
jgi:uncharacterized protein TIGR03905